MPPRIQAPRRPLPVPEWSALLSAPVPPRQESTASVTLRRKGPATLAEAVHRFVDRNWD